MMNPLLSAMARYCHPSSRVSSRPAHRRTRRTRLFLEALEDRMVPSSLSVADVTVREGPTSTGILDPAGAAALGLSGVRAITFDNMPGTPHYQDLFVTSYNTSQILRFDWATQTYQPFVTPGSGGLTNPYAVAFGADGNLYVTDIAQSFVLKFDGTTGGPLGTYVAAGSGGLTNASGLAFGPDGNLYVLSYNRGAMGQVLEYQGLSVGPNGEQPGQFMGVVCNTGTDSRPSELTFGPDGNLYVACLNYTNGAGSESGTINRYEGPSGASPGQFIDAFVPKGDGGAKYPRSPLFDSQGHLYVTDGPLNEVLRYEGPNEANPGAFLDTYVTSGQGGLVTPVGLAAGPDGNLYVGSRDANQVTRFAPASQATFTVTLDSPSASPVSVNYTTANGTAVAGTDYTATSGTLTFPAAVTSETVSVPITTVFTGGPTKTFTLSLSGAVNATIGRGQGTGSILNRMTKFFVADGGTPKTYEYGSGGTSEEITPQTSGDTAPRGLATTAAGTTVWVVDANKNVYVYTNHGVLLGSWAAGGLSINAQVTGIATNGTDIWLVDSNADKVYKYTGAASRLSGSQNAASSFNLVSHHNGSTNPQDIVTDGTSFWVVDGSAVKVFKYTLSGSLLGSWTIDPADTHPTGLTINPNNVSDIWIVDSGTLKVYQYVAAAGRTSGSQNAGATFALNPADTNPQGIADPPPADLLLAPAAPPALVEQPSGASFYAAASGALSQGPLASSFPPASSGRPSAAAVDPSLVSRDALFALLEREPLPGTSEPTRDLTTGGALTPLGDRSAPVTDGGGTPVVASGGGMPRDLLTALTPRSGSERGAMGLLDRAWIDEAGPVSAVETDTFFAGLAQDAPVED
jgi:hypothetical protein